MKLTHILENGSIVKAKKTTLDLTSLKLFSLHFHKIATPTVRLLVISNAPSLSFLKFVGKDTKECIGHMTKLFVYGAT